MFGFLEDLWDGATGFTDSLWKGLKWAFHRIVGLLEYFGSLLGILNWQKKLKVSVVILVDKDKQPIASREDVNAVVELAKIVFKNEANVKLVSPTGSEHLIIRMSPEPVPDYVMKPLCGGGGFLQVYTRVGR